MDEPFSISNIQFDKLVALFQINEFLFIEWFVTWKLKTQKKDLFYKFILKKIKLLIEQNINLPNRNVWFLNFWFENGMQQA